MAGYSDMAGACPPTVPNRKSIIVTSFSDLNLSQPILKALAAEGKYSAIILSGLPIAMFAILQTMTPNFYGAVWHIDFTKVVLACAGAWMLTGNYIMYRLVNFRI